MTSLSARCYSPLSILALGLCTLAIPASAQVTTAELSGTVTDASGSVVPGATVTVTNTGTGATRTLATDSGGRYRAPRLPAGDYEVTAELAGFRTVVRTGIHLTLGRQAVVDFRLEVGGVADEVVVSGEAPLINTQTSGLAGLMEGETIRELPINGRDFLRLTLLESGTVPVPNYRKELGKGLGLQVSLNGARPAQTGYLMDGANIKNSTNFQTPGSAAGVMLGLDAVREFEVLVNGFSAEYGQASGGVVNAVTRSGTNDFHGSAFEFHRNDALDSPNFFDTEGKPPFTRNQFGLTLGGPLVRNSTFFFVAYEGLREDLGLTTRMNVPTAETRSGNLPSGNVEVDPAVVPFLDLWPLPNGRDFGDGTGEYVFSETYPSREDLFMLRIDQRLGDADNLYLRVSLDDADVLSPKGQDANDNFGVRSKTRSLFMTAEHTKQLGSSTLNTVRLSFNRTEREGDDELLQDLDPSLQFIPGLWGNLDVSGLTRPGVDGKFPQDTTYDVYELHDQVSITQGRHAMKAGFVFSRFHNDTFGFTRIGGEYRFRSLAQFLRNEPDRLRLPGLGSDATRRWRQNLFGIFFQDNIQLSSRFTLNAGVRYEFITVPTEVDGKVANVRDIANDSSTTVGDPMFENPSLKNIAPRLGFAWDPFGNGKMSVRGGFGVYHEQLTLSALNGIGDRNLPFYFDSQFRGSGIFPDAENARLTRTPRQRLTSPNTIEFRAKQPRLHHWNLSVEREVLPQTVVSLAYAGSRGYNLGRILEGNNATPIIQPDGRAFFPEDVERLNPNFEEIDHRSQDGDSWYHSGQLRISKRMSDGFLFNLAYTFAKSIDTSSNGVGPSDYSYPSEVSNHWEENGWRGLSEFDVRHGLSVYAAYEFPRAGSLSGFASALVNGWQVAAIVAIRSGSPFPVKMDWDRAGTGGKSDTQAPDLVPGASNNPIRPGNADQYFDPSVFVAPERGYFGNLGRNTLIGPGAATVDMSLYKNHPFGESGNVQIRLEVFNLFNRVNLSNPIENVLVLNEDGPIASAGRITSTSTTARQIQLGLKVVF